MRTNNHLTVGSPTVRVAMIVVATVLLAVTLAAVGAGAQRLLAADNELVVSPDGSGNYLTISDAVAAAAEGDKILVRPGTYEESVVIDKPVSLRGDGGRDAVTIAFPADGPGVELTAGSEGDPSDPLVTYSVSAGIQLAADGIDLSGFTVSGVQPGVAIAVNEGSASLGDLTITVDRAETEETDDPAQDTRLGLIVADGAAADLRGSTLDADADALEGGTLTVEQSVLTGGGIWGDSESRLVARDNVLTDASIASDGTEATIIGNHLTRGFIGVGGDADGSYAVADNHVDGLRYDVGPGIAITAWDAGTVEITGNTVTDSDTGIKIIFFGGTALIDGNTVQSTRTGISVGGDETTVTNNTIEGSDIIGLEVFNNGPTVRDNSIIGGGTGLHLAMTDAATLSGNTVCDNVTNVRVVSGELPDLSGNEICEDAA